MAIKLDTDHLVARADAACQVWAPGSRVVSARPLPGGASSLTYVAETRGAPAGHERIVLKVAPPGVKPVYNRDVLRQARLLSALADVRGIALPRVLFSDAGAPVEVPPFFAMSFIEGESFDPHIEPPDEPSPPNLPSAENIRARALSAARQLAVLHSVDPAGVGLDAEPAMSLTAEVARWSKLFATAEDALKPGSVETGEALMAAIPAPIPPCLIHGDFRLGNTLCRGSDVTAIIDWEIWGVGDPRIDLAWFLLTADPQAHPSAFRDAPGMPRPDALLAEYQAASGRQLPDTAWFHALTLYKMASVTAVFIKQRRAAGEPASATDKAARSVPNTLARARAALASR